MIVFFLVSLLLSLISGVLLTFILLPGRRNDLHGLPFRLFVGGGLGIGLSACCYFVALAIGISRYIPLIDMAACLLLGVIAYAFRERGRRKSEPLAEWRLPARKDALPGTRSKLEIGIAAIFAVELIASLGSFLFAFLKEPHGKWDAWLIWNMHARFLYRSGEAWREVFAGGMDWSHWDYPLLLPLSIVRGWKYVGNDSLYIPAAFALLFTLLTLGLLFGALAFLRSRIQGFLAAMILMGTPLFIAMGASQFADVPLAFFMLATLVLLFLPARSSEHFSGAQVLAGITAGLCAWTKNEGLLFLLIVTGSLFFTTVYAEGWKSALRRTFRLLIGALPILLIVIYFKTQLSPANDLMEGLRPAAAAAKLTDFSRYAEIAKAFFITGISFTQGLIDLRVGMKINPGAVSILLLIVYLLLTGIRIDDRDRAGIVRTAAVLLMILAGYFFVYVMTPLDLGYHLATSLNRLFLQLWPSVIFLFFMTVRGPDMAVSAGHIFPNDIKIIPDRNGQGQQTQKNAGAEMKPEKMLSVVIPVYNERETVQEIIGKVLNLDFVAEILVVDDGSTDGTRELLERTTFDERVRCFFHDRNRGKGAALRTGFGHVMGKIVAIQDADLEYDPKEFIEMIQPILDGVADVVYGSRLSGGKPQRVHLFWHRIGNGFLTFITDLLYNTTLSDMETCYKMFRTEVLETIRIESDNFSVEPELTAKICKNKRWRIYELPISYYGRSYSEGKKITWVHGISALWTLIKYRFKS